MQKQLLAVVLTALLTNQLALAETLGAVSADRAATAAQANGARADLKRVQVAGTSDGLQVEITSSAPVVPQVTTLPNPPRLVLDLPNTALATSLRHIAVDRDGIKAVRLGEGASTARVVIDMASTRDYEVKADGNKLIVKFKGTAVAANTVTPVVSQAVAQAVAQKAAVAPTAPVNVAPVNVVPVNVAPTTVAAVAPAKDVKAKQTASATDYVVVEPTYKTVDASAASLADSKTAAASPARAIEAAAKFTEAPLNGLTSSSSAAMKSDDAANAAPKSEAAVNLAAEQKTQRQAPQPAAAGAKYTGEPISVNLKDVDLKDFFRLIHEISGLNVVLDPQVKGTLTLVLDDVPWDQALDIVLKNNELDRNLEGNVLRIATVDTLRKEAESRRAQQEAETLAVEKVTVTRFLSYARSKDIVATAKKLLSQRGDVIADDRTNALIIQDVPAVIPNIDRLLAQLDRKTQEVEIEARVVAATRNFARDIGTQFGFGVGNGHTALGGASGVGSTSTSVFGQNPQYITVGGSAATPGTQIPLFSNLGATGPTSGLTFLNFSNNVRLDAVLTMAESRGLLKILSRPKVVTQNNIQAVVKQGTRIPITTQSQLNGPPTVTYVDAFLRLTVTPQITSEGTIFLNVDVENTVPDFSRVNILTSNPTLITQQATTQVLVTDGGTVVIGGVIQTQNSLSVAQVPLLGNIPYLGNLFKRRTVTTSSQELIFFITPHIIQT